MYCSENQLNVGVDKTKNIKLRNGGSLAQGYRLHYKSEEIEYIKNFCYLGLLLSAALSVGQHLHHTNTRPLKTINLLK